MVLGNDATWWSLALGIAAIILAIPLTIIGNFVTPTVALWGLRWTDKSLAKRIAKLEAELKAIENCPLVSETEDQLLAAALCIAQLLTFTMNMFGIIVLISAVYFPTPPIPPASRPLFVFIGLGFYLLPWMWKRNTIDELKKYRHDHSPKWRTAIRKALEGYKAILTSGGAHAAQSTTAHKPSDPSAPQT